MPKTIVVDEKMLSDGFSLSGIKDKGLPNQTQPTSQTPTVSVQEGGNQSAPAPVPAQSTGIVLNKDFSVESGATPPAPVTTGNENPGAKVEEKPPVDFSSLLSQMSSGKYKSWDEVQSALESKPVMPEFKDELSKNIYDNLAAGKVDDVYKVLSIQQKLKDVDGMKGEDAVKEKMRMEHPEWDDTDIKEVYDENYLVSDDMEEKDKRRISRELKHAEREAKDFLKSKSQEIKLPAIRQPNTENNIDPKQLEQDMSKYKEARKVFEDGVQAQKEKFKGYDFKAVDDDFTITTKFEVPQEEVSAYVNDLMGDEKGAYYDKLFYNNYLDDKGNYRMDDMTKDLWMLRRDAKGVPNYQKVIENQIKQAFTDAKLAILAQFKGRTEGVSSVPLSTTKGSVQSDIDEYMRKTHRA